MLRKSPLVVILPTVYVLLGFLSLAYFRVGYILFSRLVEQHVNVPLWDTTIQPVLQQALTLLQQSLGPAEKMSFSLTHILLAAILLAVC